MMKRGTITSCVLLLAARAILFAANCRAIYVMGKTKERSGIIRTQEERFRKYYLTLLLLCQLDTRPSRVVDNGRGNPTVTRLEITNARATEVVLVTSATLSSFSVRLAAVIDSNAHALSACYGGSIAEQAVGRAASHAISIR
jgi:hypothetical protein